MLMLASGRNAEWVCY